MEYTAKQIEKAKARYSAMMVERTVESFEPQYIGWAAAEQRCDHHNRIVCEIKAGNKDLEREWKLFFLKEEVKADHKASASKAKLTANKQASADILAPIKDAKRLVEFGQWLNTAGNPFRKQHFSKQYTTEAVQSFFSK